ncbi:hypothetical protein HK102_008570 [Quaeritorhiza haematococci]|nr:hypothetical protein HK102_008570 [Quaeritorhiza haematococci]
MGGVYYPTATSTATAPPSMVMAAVPPPVPTHDERERKVVQPYEPSMPDEVRLIPGQTVIVLEAYPDQWARIFVQDTKETGMAPIGCLEGGEFHVPARFMAPEVTNPYGSPTTSMMASTPLTTSSQMMSMPYPASPTPTTETTQHISISNYKA